MICKISKSMSNTLRLSFYVMKTFHSSMLSQWNSLHDIFTHNTLLTINLSIMEYVNSQERIRKNLNRSIPMSTHRLILVRIAINSYVRIVSARTATFAEAVRISSMCMRFSDAFPSNCKDNIHAIVCIKL